MYILFIIALSRCLRAIPGLEENKSHFLIGADSGNNAYVITATYDIDTKKLSTKDLVNFEEVYKGEKIISEVLGIYTFNNDENSEFKKFYLQVFNQSENKFEIKYFEKKGQGQDEKFEPVEIDIFSYQKVFDVKIQSEEIIYIITDEKILKIDLNRPSEKEEIIIFNQNVNSSNKISSIKSQHLKICSDSSKLDHNQIAVGIGSDLYFVDLNTKTIITKVPNAHYNGILACEFDPFKTYLLSTTGMDYSVKFWDIRNFLSPVATILNNSHWVWDLKYNKRFSRVMITCSTSSVVRGIVFDKEPEVEESRETKHLNSNDHSQQDYSFIENHSSIDYVEFDDSVYSLDWSLIDPWTFAAISYNSYLYINSIPEDVKYQIMLDN